MRYSREDGCRAWLTYAELPPLKLRALLEDFGSAEAVYDRVVSGRTADLRPYCNEKQLDRLLRQADKDAMHEMMQTMRSLDIGVMTFEDAIYPIALMDIHDPPPVLFYRGNPDAWNERCLTIVGSRRASPEAIHITEGIAKELSDCGVTIVSGLAFGIDSAAHRGCMEGKSPTVAVCAAGLDHVYPAENQPLVRRILDSGGALLCEFPLGSVALKWRFPARNRVLSGLSKGVLLMEARIRSGSMTTVQHALDQGREVFAHPGVVGSQWAEGTHQLLREGARYFTSANDVLEDLGWDAEASPTPEQRSALPSLSQGQLLVLTALKGGELSFDQLAERTHMEVSELTGTITILQLLGLIRALPGKCYCAV